MLGRHLHGAVHPMATLLTVSVASMPSCGWADRVPALCHHVLVCCHISVLHLGTTRVLTSETTQPEPTGVFACPLCKHSEAYQGKKKPCCDSRASLCCISSSAGLVLGCEVRSTGTAQPHRALTPCFCSDNWDLSCLFQTGLGKRRDLISLLQRPEVSIQAVLQPSAFQAFFSFELL